MKKTLIAFIIILGALSCTKENTENSNHEQTIPTSEFEVLKQEVAEMKSQIQNLTSSTQTSGVSMADFNALKQENEELKAQIGLLTSGFFEVDGLRFDKNGVLISVPKIEDEISEKSGEKTRTTTRKYDDKGRLIQIYREYSGGSSILAGSPYYWQKVIYEYNGMTCKITTQTSKSGLPAGVPYEEEIKESSYW